LPTHRDDRGGDTLEYYNYFYADLALSTQGLFDPTASPVQIAFGSLNEVVFSITNSLTSNPVQNAVITVNGAVLPATDVNGETSTALAAGSCASHGILFFIELIQIICRVYLTLCKYYLSLC